MAMVSGSVFGEEAFAGRGGEGVPNVGEDDGWSGSFGQGWVQDEAYAEFVGGTFEA